MPRHSSLQDKHGSGCGWLLTWFVLMPICGVFAFCGDLSYWPTTFFTFLFMAFVGLLLLNAFYLAIEFFVQ